MTSQDETAQLLAVSPIDGRYRRNTKGLSEYFSEFALFKYRVLVEVEYFAALSKVPEVTQLQSVTDEQIAALRASAITAFTVKDAAQIKETDARTLMA